MRRCLIAITALTLTGAAPAPSSLVQNEYAFVRAVAEQGIRDGFLMYLDKQAVTFSPKPVNAHDLYQGRKPSATKLDWYPAYALVASSGDFGVDTGPWTATWTQDGKPQQAYGEWLTIWSRNKAGAWHALFDSGVGHDTASNEKALKEGAEVVRLTGSGTHLTAEQAHKALLKAETDFNAVAGDGALRAAYAQFGSDGIRLLRQDKLPVVGRDKVVNDLPAGKSALTWKPSGGSVATSGDIGYLYGMTYQVDDKGFTAPVTSYMHVWQRDKDRWWLLIALDAPLPPPPPPQSVQNSP
jgi:hypothetical protein